MDGTLDTDTKMQCRNYRSPSDPAKIPSTDSRAQKSIKYSNPTQGIDTTACVLCFQFPWNNNLRYASSLSPPLLLAPQAPKHVHWHYQCALTPHFAFLHLGLSRGPVQLISDLVGILLGL
jgi:hypothetical protein